MIITVLAIVFLSFTVLTVLFIYRAITRKEKTLAQSDTGRCSLCRGLFGKKLLIERQVGDYKMMYFCRECIENLHADLSTTLQPGTGSGSPQQ